jgi:hypothetical protein
MPGTELKKSRVPIPTGNHPRPYCSVLVILQPDSQLRQYPVLRQYICLNSSILSILQPSPQLWQYMCTGSFRPVLSRRPHDIMTGSCTPPKYMYNTLPNIFLQFIKLFQDSYNYYSYPALHSFLKIIGYRRPKSTPF